MRGRRFEKSRFVNCYPVLRPLLSEWRYWTASLSKNISSNFTSTTHKTDDRIMIIIRLYSRIF